MKMKQCPECDGSGRTPGMKPVLVDPIEINGELCGTPAIINWNCYICEGHGEIPDEPVSHCLGCGEPIPLGDKWCEFHAAAAELSEGDR